LAEFLFNITKFEELASFCLAYFACELCSYVFHQVSGIF
jgi:hypothetical protein